MATFVVCSRCGTTQEIAALDQLPKLWQRSGATLACPRCAITNEDDVVGDVLDEEVIYPRPGDDTLDEDFDENFEEECEICAGPCQGH